MTTRFFPLLWLLFASCPKHSAEVNSPPRWQERDAGADLRLDLAEQFLLQGDAAKALALLASVESTPKKSAKLDYLRGWALFEQGAWTEAEALLKGVLQRSPRHHAALARLAELYSATDRVPEAISALRDATAIAPETARYWNNLGFLLDVAGTHGEAVTALKRAVALDGSHAQYKNNLGFAYAHLGEWATAETAFQSAGQPPEAQFNMGLAYEAAGNFSKAAEHYQRVLRYTPEHPQARASLQRLSEVKP